MRVSIALGALTAAAVLGGAANAQSPAVTPPSGAINIVYLGKGADSFYLVESTTARKDGNTGDAWMVNIFAADREIAGNGTTSGIWSRTKFDCAAKTSQANGVAAIRPDGSTGLAQMSSGSPQPVKPDSASDYMRRMACENLTPAANMAHYSTVAAAIAGVRAMK